MRSLHLAAIGVVISTAFVHVMLPAVHIFEDDCFPEFFKSYEGWPAVFILVGFLLTHVVHLCTSACHHEKNGIESQRKFGLVSVELGIAVHSVIIGIALGIAIDEFVALLVAISIHQFFEGIAVATIVVQVQFKKFWNGIIVAAIFILSTPVGVMLGLLIRNFSTNY